MTSNWKIKTREIGQELLTIFWSYLNTYFIAVLVFTVFFAIYAGIKTNRIPAQYLIAAILGILAFPVLLFLFAIALHRVFKKLHPELYEEILGDLYQTVPNILSLYPLSLYPRYKEKTYFRMLFILSSTQMVAILFRQTVTSILHSQKGKRGKTAQ